jgi:uridine kinase
MKTIHIRLEGKDLKVPAQTTTLALIAEKLSPELGLARPIGALVDNRLVPLDTSLYDGACVNLVSINTEAGMEIYRRGCTLLLRHAARRLFPDVRLVVGQSLGNGYFFDWKGQPPLAPESVRALEETMKQMVEEDLPFERERVGVSEAIRRFRQRGMDVQASLLEVVWHENVRLVLLGDTLDILHGPVPPSAGFLTGFSLAYYPPGLVLKFPDAQGGPPDQSPPNQKKLFAIHRETKEFNRRLGVENVGELNRLCINGGIAEIIRVSEGFHEKRIAAIADAIAERADRVRIVLIAGPSSSGKTTFLKRLSVQLEVNGLRPVGLSIDDYYVNREDTPRDENGAYDFEALEAIDLALFNTHLVQLLEGREVITPRFDFNSGRRLPESKGKPLKLQPRDILIVEGIHGLNDRLTAQVPREAKFKIYVSALTQLCLDDTNRIHTTDGRLLRRIVRDRLYRGYKAATTLSVWPSVLRGERRHIFPFQEDTDEMFNSALVYETAVLKVYAERFLLEVPLDDPAYPEVHRLMKFLSLFVGIFPDAVPQNSILREFIGGSTFRY